MTDISTKEDISSITRCLKKTSISVLRRNSSGRESSNELNYDDVQTCAGRYLEENDRIDTNIVDDIRSEKSVHRETATNARELPDVSEHNDNGISEFEGYQAQESQQSLKQCRGISISDNSSEFQENQNASRDSEAKRSRVTALYELGKNRNMVNRESVAMKSKVDTFIVDIESIRHSQRVTDLYELGKQRVISKRETADTNSLAIDNLAAKVAALSETKASVSEIAGHRLFTQAKLSADRKDKLMQIARDIPLPKMKLATQRQSHNARMDWKRYRKVKNYRIATLYKLGKNRVMARREMAAKNEKVDTVTINIEPIRCSQRIVDLYMLGKRKVMIDRKLAAEKLLVIDNLAANVIFLSDTKASPSEIAGQRLFIQAKLSAERIAKLRQKVKESPLPQMKLETKKRSHIMPIKWSTSPIERFCMLYEKGRNQVATKREVEMKDKITNLNEKVNAGHASTRQLELYVMGTQSLVMKRSDKKQHSDADNVSTKLQTKIEANDTMIRLYEMSKKRQEDGKKRRQGFVGGDNNMNLTIDQSCSSLDNISPNATMVKLYAMSEIMREYGKKRREKIVNGKLNFPVIKV